MRPPRRGASPPARGCTTPLDDACARRGSAGAPVIELLLLADSRLPSGGHGHSGGVEALVDRGLLGSVDDLALFLEGRVRTGGRVVAAAAAAAGRAALLLAEQGPAASADAPTGRAGRPPSPRAPRPRPCGPRRAPRGRRCCAPSPWRSRPPRSRRSARCRACTIRSCSAPPPPRPAPVLPRPPRSPCTTSSGAPSTAAVRLLGLDPLRGHRRRRRCRARRRPRGRRRRRARRSRRRRRRPGPAADRGQSPDRRPGRTAPRIGGDPLCIVTT